MVSFVSFLTPPVPCLTSPVSGLLSHDFCLLSPISRLSVSCLSVLCLFSHISCPYLTFPVSQLLSPVSLLLSHVSCVMSPVSRLLSNVSCLTSPYSCLLSVSHLLSYILFLLSHIYGLSPVVSLEPSVCLSHVSYLSHISCLLSPSQVTRWMLTARRGEIGLRLLILVIWGKQLFRFYGFQFWTKDKCHMWAHTAPLQQIFHLNFLKF